MIENLAHNHLTPFLAHGLLALFGAFTHAAVVYRAGNTKNILDFTILVVMSSFSGVMFALIGFELFGEMSYMSMALAGTGGFIGVEGMTFVISFITKKIK